MRLMSAFILTAHLSFPLLFTLPFKMSHAADLLSAVDCAAFTEAPYSYGTIQRLLERDGISREKIAFAKKLRGSEGAVLYTTDRGFRVILKPAQNGHEVAAYAINLRFGFRIMAQTEELLIDGERMTAVKFVGTSGPRSVIDRFGRTREVDNLADVASNDFPDELILQDALTGNLDRGGKDFEQKNFLILTRDSSTPDLRNGPYIVPNARFVAIDHGLAFMDMDLERWASTYGWRKPGGFKLSDFGKILKRNPDFVRELKRWTPDTIKTELAGKVEARGIESVIARRAAILKLAR